MTATSRLSLAVGDRRTRSRRRGRRTAARTASGRSRPRLTWRSTAWTHDSPSLVPRTVIPSAMNWRRSSALLTTLPLCAPTRSPSESRWGWALAIDGAPNVAQRSCAMPRSPVSSAKRSSLGDLVDPADVLAQVDRAVGGDRGGAHRVVAAVGEARAPPRSGPRPAGGRSRRRCRRSRTCRPPLPVRGLGRSPPDRRAGPPPFAVPRVVSRRRREPLILACCRHAAGIAGGYPAVRM